jgi:hypothetical protein
MDEQIPEANFSTHRKLMLKPLDFDTVACYIIDTIAVQNKNGGTTNDHDTHTHAGTRHEYRTFQRSPGAHGED